MHNIRVATCSGYQTLNDIILFVGMVHWLPMATTSLIVKNATIDLLVMFQLATKYLVSGWQLSVPMLQVYRPCVGITRQPLIYSLNAYSVTITLYYINHMLSPQVKIGIQQY